MQQNENRRDVIIEISPGSKRHKPLYISIDADSFVQLKRFPPHFNVKPQAARRADQSVEKEVLPVAAIYFIPMYSENIQVYQ